MNCEDCVHEKVCEGYSNCEEAGLCEPKRQHGEWLPFVLEGTERKPIAWKCSICGRSPVFAVKSDYCPNCGAPMTEGAFRKYNGLKEGEEK